MAGFRNLALMNGGWRAGWTGLDGQSFDLDWAPGAPDTFTMSITGSDGEEYVVLLPATIFASAALAVNHARESRIFEAAVRRAQKAQRDAQDPGGAT